MTSARTNIGVRHSRVMALSASLVGEFASGLLPLMIVPVLISRLGAEAYGLTLAPLALTGLLASVLDLGLTLGMPALWIQQGRNTLRTRYVTATIQIKLAAVLAANLVFWIAWWVAAPEEVGMIWAGACLVMIGQILYPNWIFIVLGRTIEGQILNACSRIIPILLLFTLLQPGNSPVMVNLLLGLGSLTGALVSYVMLLPLVRSTKCSTWGFFVKDWRLTRPLVWRHSRLWIAQLSQSIYRTSLPVIASIFLGPTTFLAYSVSEKCMRALQSAQSYVLLFDFSRLIRPHSKDSIGRHLFDRVVTHVLTMSIGLSIAFYFVFQWVAPLIFSGNTQIIQISHGLAPLLSALIIVGGLNYWLGSLGLPVTNRGDGLLTASVTAGIVALGGAALASQQASAMAFLLAMSCGEVIFLGVVLMSYRK